MRQLRADLDLYGIIKKDTDALTSLCIINGLEGQKYEYFISLLYSRSLTIY